MSKRLSKRIYQNILHLFVYIVVREICFVTRLFPAFSLNTLSKTAGYLTYVALRKSRRRVIDNLSIAFGKEKTQDEIFLISKQLFQELFLNFFELIYLSKIPLERIINMVEVEGEENLKEALQQNKGVVGICSHLGNFPYMQVRLQTEGYPINAIIRDSNNVYIARFARAIRKKANIPSISKWNLQKAIRQSHNNLKNNGIVCFYLDQHARNGVPAELFGREIYIPAGAAVFARKYNAPAVGIFTFRLPSGKHKVVIEKPYPLKRTSSSSQDIQDNSAYFIKRVEKYVREHPEQWFSWLHRRFR